jgi:hypothetical protein
MYESEENYVKVLYDYMASNADEVTIHKDDFVSIKEIEPLSGWTKIFIRGKYGLVPTAYLCLARDSAVSIPKRKAIAIYSYEKNMEDELTITAGESVKIHSIDDAGWTCVENLQGIGLVPTSYINMLSD